VSDRYDPVISLVDPTVTSYFNYSLLGQRTNVISRGPRQNTILALKAGGKQDSPAFPGIEVQVVICRVAVLVTYNESDNLHHSCSIKQSAADI